MRCRVAQNWSGNGWGGMVIPRVGMEVLVEFLDGDPDKPLVTGCVYNGRNKVPYELPRHKTRSTFRTDTHQGTGFNEVRFEDENGREEIFVHAERDMHLAIENDRAEMIGGNRFTVVDQASHEVVQIAKSSLTGLSELRTVGRSYHLKVGGGVGSALAFSMVARKAQEAFTGLKTLLLGRSITAPAGYFKDVTGVNSVTVSEASTESVGTEKTVTCGSSMTLTTGANLTTAAATRTTMSSGTDTLVLSGESIVLRTGKAKLKMTSDGHIQLTGTRIDLN